MRRQSSTLRCANFQALPWGTRKTKEKAIHFICLADAADALNSEGYWMQLSQWNRFRNDTFKDRRDDELPFIPGQAPAAGVVSP